MLQGILRANKNQALSPKDSRPKAKQMGAEAILVFFIAGVVLVGGGAFAAKLLSPKSTNKDKWEPYESGMKTIGTTWVQFKVGYFLVAILFLMFDVETIFLFPWAVAMKSVGMVAFVEILVFILILGLGLLYAYKKGAFKWE